MRILKNGYKTGRSISLLMAIAATTGLILSGWVLEKSRAHSSFELATGGAALAVILVAVIGWMSFREAMERGRAEDALQASEERFHLFAEGVHEYAIILLDREGMVVSWNAGAERAKGYKAEQIIGRWFAQGGGRRARKDYRLTREGGKVLELLRAQVRELYEEVVLGEEE